MVQVVVAMLDCGTQWPAELPTSMNANRGEVVAATIDHHCMQKRGERHQSRSFKRRRIDKGNLGARTMQSCASEGTGEMCRQEAVCDARSCDRDLAVCWHWRRRRKATKPLISRTPSHVSCLPLGSASSNTCSSSRRSISEPLQQHPASRSSACAGPDPRS
jgi:hypothetical protein